MTTREENPRKQAMRLKLEATVFGNKQLPTTEVALSPLSGLPLQYHGVDHPTLKDFPLTNALILPLPSRTASRTGCSHYIKLCKDGWPHSTTPKDALMVNLKDYKFAILDSKPTVFRKTKYIKIGLETAEWASVLLPINIRLYYRLVTSDA